MKRLVLLITLSAAAILLLACGTSALPTPMPPAPTSPPTDSNEQIPAISPSPTQRPNGPAMDDLPRELNDSRQLWESKELEDYQFVYQKICFCAPEDVAPVNVSVREGKIVAVTFVDSGLPVSEADFKRYSTIDDLFELIQDAIDRDADKISVEYDADLGYPLRTNIDYVSGIADEELGFTASDLEPIAN